jgi:hypothetical protein
MKAKETLFDKLLKHTVLVSQEANVKWLFNLSWLKYHIVNDMFEKHIMSNREEGIDQRDLMIQFGDFDDSPNLDLLHRFMLKSHQTYPGSRGFLHFLFLPKIEKWKNSVEKTRPNYDYSTDKDFGDLITAFYMRRITLEEFGTKYKELTNFDISHLYPEFSPILNSIIEKE